MQLRELAVEMSKALLEVGNHALHDQLKPHDLTLDPGQAEASHCQFSSEIDDRVVRFCHERLNAIQPHESWEAVGSDVKPGGLYWCVGRIDGSVNFVRNMPEWAITAALIRVDNAGYSKPIIGVVHAPALHRTYIAAEGMGSIRIRLSGHENAKREKTIPSTTSRLKGSILSFGMSYFPEESRRAIETVSAMAGLPADIKRVGPVSLDICKVADGSYDAFFEPSLHSWDVPAVMAASVVLQEAQGRLTRWDGQPIVWGGINDIVASNGPIMDELQPYLNTHQ